MKTQIKKIGDTIVVSMNGKLDFDTHVPLREDLNKLNRANSKTGEKSDSTPKKIIFNLEALEFVGSSGISSFVQALKDFNKSSPTKPRYCHVRSEFKRMIQAFEEDDVFEIYETEEKARKSFDQ